MQNNIIKKICENQNIKHIVLKRLRLILKDNVSDFDYVLNNTTDLEFYAYYHNKYKTLPVYSYFEKNKHINQKRMYDRKFNFIKSIIDIKNKKMLDIGTEDCYYTKLFEQYGSKMSAINIQMTLNYVGNKNCIQLYNGFAIPHNDNTFDVVLIQMVLHHVIDHYNDLLKDVYRVLKKGGVFIIEDHDFSNEYVNNLIDVYHLFYELIESKDFNTDYYANYKVRRFTKNELIQELKNIGFQPPRIIEQKDDRLNRFHLIAKK